MLTSEQCIIALFVVVVLYLVLNSSCFSDDDCTEVAGARCSLIDGICECSGGMVEGDGQCFSGKGQFA